MRLCVEAEGRLFRGVGGSVGLNYLCAGLKTFFQHTEKPMKMMADLLGRGRYAREIMPVLASEGGSWETRLAGAGRNDPCPCGSGLKFKRCHGQR